MIEEVILDFLNDMLDVSAYTEEPEQEEKYVLLERIGGGRVDFINRATYTLQSYAGSLYEAAELNEQVKEAMEEITQLYEISSVKLNSDYNYTDKEKKRYRYQAVFDIVYF